MTQLNCLVRVQNWKSQYPEMMIKMFDFIFDFEDYEIVNRKCLQNILDLLKNKDITLLSNSEIGNLLDNISMELEIRKRKLK